MQLVAVRGGAMQVVTAWPASSCSRGHDVRRMTRDRSGREVSQTHRIHHMSINSVFQTSCALEDLQLANDHFIVRLVSLFSQSFWWVPWLPKALQPTAA